MSRKSGKNNNKDKSDDDLCSVSFKFPGRFATLKATILIHENLTLCELLRTVPLDLKQQPPDGKRVFELFYCDEILPRISKHAPEIIHTPKSIEKSWDLQTSDFKKIYVKRAEILRHRWLKMEKHSHSPRANCDSNQAYAEMQSASSPSTTAAAATPHFGDAGSVIFKYYSVHSSAKTNRHIFITPPTKQELIERVGLSIDYPPPNGKALFEIYYYDEILPFLKKSGQQSIRGKKDLAKTWEIQTKVFKNLYEARAKILNEEWLKMKSDAKQKLKKKKQQKREKQKNASQLSLMSNASFTSQNSVHNCELDKRLVRTLLNFLLFMECNSQEKCAMLLIADESERHSKYLQFEQQHLKRMQLAELVCLHIRVYIDCLDAECLRLHTSKHAIKLCFVSRVVSKIVTRSNDENLNEQQSGKNNEKTDEEELLLFELQFCKLLPGLDDKIDHQRIEASLNHETRILSLDVPLR